jgi:hypothetical protein
MTRIDMSTVDYDNPTVHSDKPVRRRTKRGDGEVLSPAEAVSFARGQELKRYVRSAAALRGMYDDTAIGEAVGRTRIAVGKWWRGAKPEPEAVRALADATGLAIDELGAFIYYDGPPPHLPDPEEAEARERADAAERSGRVPPTGGASAGPRAPHEKAGSGR